MATVKKGMLTATGEWWRHLRYLKRDFWKAERRAAEKEIAKQVGDGGAEAATNAKGRGA